MNTQTELKQDKELIYKRIILNLMKDKKTNNGKMPTEIFKTWNFDEALLVSECLNYFLGGSEIKQLPDNKTMPKKYSHNFEVSSKGYYYYIGS